MQSIHISYFVSIHCKSCPLTGTHYTYYRRCTLILPRNDYHCIQCLTADSITLHFSDILILWDLYELQEKTCFLRYILATLLSTPSHKSFTMQLNTISVACQHVSHTSVALLLSYVVLRYHSARLVHLSLLCLHLTLTASTPYRLSHYFTHDVLHDSISAAWNWKTKTQHCC